MEIFAEAWQNLGAAIPILAVGLGAHLLIGWLEAREVRRKWRARGYYPRDRSRKNTREV